jgi:hypothetical protein
LSCATTYSILTNLDLRTARRLVLEHSGHFLHALILPCLPLCPLEAVPSTANDEGDKHKRLEPLHLPQDSECLSVFPAKTHGDAILVVGKVEVKRISAEEHLDGCDGVHLISCEKLGDLG